MHFGLPLLRRLTAVTAIALVLVGAVVSGHARAAHLGGLTSDAPPCHHALSNDGVTADNAALDLCRELCLNKVPDTAITAATVHFSAAPALDAQPAYVEYSAPRTFLIAVPVAASDHRPRPAAYPAATRLLI
jgi:hypothetical protein